MLSTSTNQLDKGKEKVKMKKKKRSMRLNKNFNLFMLKVMTKMSIESQSCFSKENMLRSRICKPN